MEPSRFLLVLAGCVPMCGGVRMIVRSIRLGHHRTGPGIGPPELGTYEPAFLAGGPLAPPRPSSPPWWTTTCCASPGESSCTPPPTPPRRKAPWSAPFSTPVRESHGTMNAHDARETLARSREIDGIRTRLVAAGLVHRPWGSGVTRAKFFLLLAVPVLAAGLTVAGPSPSCSRPTSTSG